MTAATPDNAAYCAALVREQDFDRYATTLFAPPAQRRALLALFAFNVEIVRVREQVTQPLPGEVRLQWWSDLFAGTAHGGAEGNPVAAELMWAIGAHSLPTAPLARLIEAHLFDLYNDPMPDLAALQDYLDATVGGLLGLAAGVLGASEGAVAHLARHAGVAVGIARLIEALPKDAARRQLFLPLQTLTEAGCGLEEVFSEEVLSGKPTPALRAALASLIAEARRHLEHALTLLPEAPAAARLAFLPLAPAKRDLDRMAAPPSDLFAPPPRSRLATLWTLWRAARTKAFR